MKKEIVLLHGALGASDQFNSLQKTLDEMFQTRLFDLPGHGKLGKVIDRFSIKEFANELNEYIKKNSLNKPCVFGYSMGGYVALYLEAILPGTFNRIMTLATKYCWTPEISERESKMIDPDVIESKLPEFATVLEKRHTVLGWKNVLNMTARMMIELGSKPVLDRAILKSVTCNCMMCVGDKDKMVSIEETVELYRSVKNSNLMVIPDTPHPLEKVSVERLKFEIVRFFD